MSVVDALSDRDLFGTLPPFEDLTSWRPWIAFLRAFYGLPMDADDLALFRKHTGLKAPSPDGYQEAAVITGRQSGKTQLAAVVGVYEAAQALLRGDRGVVVPLMAQDARSATRALFGYVKEACESSALLKREITRSTTTELELGGRVAIAVYPCRPASVRGIRAPFAAVDELAHFTSTDGRPTDTETLRAIRPTLATTGGRLLILSSPYAQSGELWALHRRHHGQDTNVLVWQATAPEMHPTLSSDYLERMKTDDPEAYKSEVLGEFRAGLSMLFDPEALDAVVDSGVRERLPQGRKYSAHFDASGGRRDAAVLAIAHSEEDHAILDLIRAWPAPHSPAEVIAAASVVLKKYGVSRVTVDRFGGDFPVDAFKSHGITAEPAPKSTSDTYLELLPLVNAGAVRLLDDPDLLRELRGLERRAGANKDRVDHRSGAHDDRAAACAGALVSVKAPRKEHAVFSWLQFQYGFVPGKLEEEEARERAEHEARRRLNPLDPINRRK